MTGAGKGVLPATSKSYRSITGGAAVVRRGLQSVARVWGSCPDVELDLQCSADSSAGYHCPRTMYRELGTHGVLGLCWVPNCSCGWCEPLLTSISGLWTQPFSHSATWRACAMLEGPSRHHGPKISDRHASLHWAKECCVWDTHVDITTINNSFKNLDIIILY